MANNMVITRVFDAPRELVFKAWTDPDLVKQWWGPSSFTAPHAEIDLREGGRVLLCMRTPDGREMWNAGTIRELAAPSRLVMTQYVADEAGNLIPPEQYGMPPDYQAETLITVNLEPLPDGRTKLTLEHSIPAEMAQETGALAGWNGSLDKMAAAVQQALEAAG